MEYLSEVSGEPRLVPLLSACLSLRSAVETAVVQGAERKRVGLGGGDSSIFVFTLVSV